MAVLCYSAAQEPAQSRREFTIDGEDSSSPRSVSTCQQDDLVKITFKRGRAAASRSMIPDREARAGQDVVFEFRADQPGTLRFYCNLTADDRCRKMEGELIVR